MAPRSTSTIVGTTPTSMPGGPSTGSVSTSCCRQRARSQAADERLSPLVTRELLVGLTDALPDDWLATDPVIGDAASQRRAYVDYLLARLAARTAFVEEADRARAAA